MPRRAFERHELTNSRVHARIWLRKKGPPAVGRVTNASITGMWIETSETFPLKTEVTVELLVLGGYSAVLPGRIVRREFSPGQPVKPPVAPARR